MNISNFNTNVSSILDMKSVLQQLLFQIRNLTSSEAGTIYIKDEDFLKFSIFQNDAFSDLKIEKLIDDLKEIKLPICDKKYIAVDSFISSEIIKIDDVYDEKKYDTRGIILFDKKFAYKTYSMLTIPLIDFHTKNNIGVLQIINKKEEKEFVFYSDGDIELLKMIGGFIGYIISKIIGYGNSLTEISKALEENIGYKFDDNKIDSFYNNIVHFNRILRNISHKYRHHLSELSMNNMYLSKILDNNTFIDYFNENEVIIQNLSNLIESHEEAYEYHNDVAFNLSNAFKTSLNLLETELNNLSIKVEKNIDESIFIKGEKNIFIQIILSVLHNSIDAHKKAENKEANWINLVAKKDRGKTIIIFEDNAGGIEKNLLKTLEQDSIDYESPSNSISLRIARIVLQNKFGAQIFFKNTNSGFLVKIILKKHSFL